MPPRPGRGGEELAAAIRKLEEVITNLPQRINDAMAAGASGSTGPQINAASPEEMRFAAGAPSALAEPAEAKKGPLRGYRKHDMASEAAGGIGEGVLGAIPGLIAGAGDYAASKTPYGTTGTTDMLGQNLQMGMLKGLSDLAAPIPVLGSYIQNQFKGLEEAVYAPEQRARGKLSPVFEQMAQAGIDVSDREVTEAFNYALPGERRAVAMKQRVERIGAAANADNGAALSGALSQIGL